MAFAKITDSDLKGKGNVGRPDTPGVSTAEMQRILDEIPREVIVPAFNALIAALNSGNVAAEFGAQVPSQLPNDTESNVQGVVNALASYTENHIKDKNNPHSVAAMQVGTQIPNGLPAETKETVQDVQNALMRYVQNHEKDKNNPHKVTAAQVDAYTKKQTDDAIDDAIAKKVIEIGAGDMNQATYDPQGRRRDIFNEIDNVSNELNDRMSRMEYMAIHNDFSAPIAVDNAAILVDDTGNAILADWKYKEV